MKLIYKIIPMERITIGDKAWIPIHINDNLMYFFVSIVNISDNYSVQFSSSDGTVINVSTVYERTYK